MEPTTAHEPRHNRFLIIVLALSALPTAGHFVSGHYMSDMTAKATVQAEYSCV
jgi:hypothetical protein